MIDVNDRCVIGRNVASTPARGGQLYRQMETEMQIGWGGTEDF